MVTVVFGDGYHLFRKHSILLHFFCISFSSRLQPIDLTLSFEGVSSGKLVNLQSKALIGGHHALKYELWI